MGWLTNSATGERQYLAQRSLIGRAAQCWVRIAHSSVSNEHAVLFFDADGWAVKDLASLNGTWVNGTKLQGGESARIGNGSELQFGEVTARVASIEPPTLCVRGGPGGGCVIAHGGMLVLPDEETPIASLYEAEVDSWVADVEGRVQPLNDGDVLYIGKERYQVHLPNRDARVALERTVATRPRFSLSELKLRFEVSQDNEAIVVTLLGETSFKLQPRAAHRVLLLLASQRVKDQAASVGEAECGWVFADEIPQMLGYDRERINVDIHRLRQQFAKSGVVDAAQLIERRPTTHQVRLSIREIEIA